MISISTINIERNDAAYKKFKNNLKLVLQKIGSSNKTKVIHNLIDRDLLYIGYGTKDIGNRKSAMYGSTLLAGNKLSAIIADISKVVDNVELQHLVKLVKDINTANNSLSKAKTTITDVSTIQIDTLTNTINKLFLELVDNLDYFNLVDIYYYLYLEALTRIGLKGKGKNKIFEVTHDVFKDVIERIFTKVNINLENENKQKFNIIMDYIFARKFTDQTSNMVLVNLQKVYSKENVQFLIDLHPSKYNELKNIATLLTKANIVNMTESAFITNFRILAGDFENIVNGGFDELVAYIISTKYSSSIFEAPAISPHHQDRLEQLILNFKRDIILK